MAKPIKFRAGSGKAATGGNTAFNFGANTFTKAKTSQTARGTKRQGGARRTQSATGGGGS